MRCFAEICLLIYKTKTGKVSNLNEFKSLLKYHSTLVLSILIIFWTRFTICKPIYQKLDKCACQFSIVPGHMCPRARTFWRSVYQSVAHTKNVLAGKAPTQLQTPQSRVAKIASDLLLESPTSEWKNWDQTSSQYISHPVSLLQK